MSDRLMIYDRNILLLCLIFLLSSLATNFISPFLPLYITSLKASATELGMVMAASEAVTALVLIISGMLSDRYGRKRIHALGTFLSIFPPLLYTFASHWLDLAPWVILSGAALGLYIPIRWSIPADLSETHNLAMTYSLTNVAWLIGSTVGPLLGGLIADVYGIKTPFFICSALLIGAFCLALMLQETKKREPSEVRHVGEEVKPIPFLQAIILFSLINLLQGAGTGLFFTPLAVFAVKRYSVSNTFVGLLSAIGFGFASIVVQIPAGKLAGVYDRRKIMLVTFIVSAPFYGFFALSRNPVELIVMMFLSNAILNFSWPAFQALMMELTPSAKLGLMNGISATTFWAGTMTGSAASGILWDSFYMHVPYYVSAIAFFLAVVPVLFLKETRTKLQT